MDIKTAFGKALKEQRKIVGISQENLAFESGIDRTFIYRVERGKSQPTVETLFALAGALEMLPSELLAKTESKLRLKR